MGYIYKGKYHSGSPPDAIIGTDRTMMSKQYNHDMQRADHRADLVQPYNRDGSVNDEFINLYPDESKEYGFIKEDDNGQDKS